MIAIGSYQYYAMVIADYVADMEQSVRNAASLEKYRRLDTEIKARDISDAELIRQVTAELDAALAKLEVQIKYSDMSQERTVQYIKEINDKNVGEASKEEGIKDAGEIYDSYRQGLQRVTDEIKRIRAYNRTVITSK